MVMLEKLKDEWELELSVVQSRLESVLEEHDCTTSSSNQDKNDDISMYCIQQLNECGDLSKHELTREAVCVLAHDMALHGGDFLHSDPATPVEVVIEATNINEEVFNRSVAKSGSVADPNELNTPGTESGGVADDVDVDDDELSKDQKKMQQCIKDFKLLAEKGMPSTKLEDIIGYNDVKQLINQLFVLPRRYPEYFTRTDLQHILLFGEPGCGKTAFASAIAHEFGNCQFVMVTPSDINGKYIGESEKRLKALFSFANSVGRIVIFFDEIDGLLPSRTAPGNSNLRTLVTQFLILSQGAFSEPKDVLMVAATNLPMNLDEGVQRRFKKRIYIGMPDATTREQLFLHYYGQENYNKLSEKCPPDFFENELNKLLPKLTCVFCPVFSYTCADVKEFALNLKEVPFMKALGSKYFVFQKSFTTNWGETLENKWVPCKPSCEGAKYISLESIPPAQLFIPPPAVKPDFYAVASCMKPTGCLPANNVLLPTSMKEQLTYYQKNHGFSPEKFTKYCKQYELNIEEAEFQKIIDFFNKKYKEISANSEEFQLDAVKADLLEMVKVFSDSDRLSEIRNDIDSRYSKLALFFRQMSKDDRKRNSSMKWMNLAKRTSSLFTLVCNSNSPAICKKEYLF
ncbi:Vacuolar protein sorting-associated protein 4B [Orchesella cincta]|uniref:Vacuolar protein sorting-associated protein 4B n=1 Tax=Orchesella cincta TaxID=48709 RepID=A0A1D2M6C5_ORCCI|nr:Vacuolar protein sorting-associated protein 4B [Orchesella cincta]